MRSYYQSSISDFLSYDSDKILGSITRSNVHELSDLQRNSWIEEIVILKKVLKGLDGHISFEYSIPRMGKRVDVILIINNLIFLLEFKIGAFEHTNEAKMQVIDYALDLQDFHEESHNVTLIPFLVSTNAAKTCIKKSYLKKNIFEPSCCNEKTLRQGIDKFLNSIISDDIDAKAWLNSPYKPTPTIIEAAQFLYRQHSVEDITRSDAHNISETTQYITKIINEAKIYKKHVICFITGVPGAGKTLAGLNLAIECQINDINDQAVLLSGNGPLVKVLQEALARDNSQKEGITKKDATRKTKKFIQNIHQFRDDILIDTSKPPTEKVVIFDEAQRAWTQPALAAFMKKKKGKKSFYQSEPQFLIDAMNKHKDWAVIVCLIGGGQEINRGEAGLPEWFDSLRNHFPNWEIHVSDKITDSEYIRNYSYQIFIKGLNINIHPSLHLAVSIRSYRSENVSSFVKSLLDADIVKARMLYRQLKGVYPIVITRNIDKAKSWVKEKATGSSHRYGLTASSGALRLKAEGIWVKNEINPSNWFLNSMEDIRSSYALEDTATEFDIQGLELDWSIVAWDANLRFDGKDFCYYQLKGTKWNKINNSENALYLKNSYRVLLTRARQGFVIFVPYGDSSDSTRKPEYYDTIFQYLVSIGLQEI